MNARSTIRLAALAALLATATVAGYLLGWFDYDRIAALATTIRHGRDREGVAIAFVAAYVLATGAGLPSTPPTLAGGAMFGATLGALLSWLGALGGSAVGYWVARSLGARSIRRRLCRHPAMRRLADDERGFMAMLRLRLIPVVPLGVVNFGAGLARMHFGSYMAATAIGLLPSVVIYSYFADAVLSRVAGAEHAAIWRVGVASILLLVISFLPTIFRRRAGARPGRRAPAPVREKALVSTR